MGRNVRPDFCARRTGRFLSGALSAQDTLAGLAARPARENIRAPRKRNEPLQSK